MITPIHTHHTHMFTLTSVLAPSPSFITPPYGEHPFLLNGQSSCACTICGMYVRAKFGWSAQELSIIEFPEDSECLGHDRWAGQQHFRRLLPNSLRAS